MKFLIHIFLISYILSPSAHSADENSFSIKDFEKISVLHEGRVKPIDSFSKLLLKDIYGKESYKDEMSELDSNQWFIELIFEPQKAYNRKIFKINNPSTIGTLGLKESSKYYSFIELYKSFSENQAMLHSLLSVDKNDLDPNNLHLTEIYQKFMTYMGLSRSFSFFFKDFSLNEKLNYSYFDLKKIQNPNIPKSILEFYSITEDDAQFKNLLISHNNKTDLWLTPWEEMEKEPNGQFLTTWNNLYTAYTTKDSSAFNKAVSALVPTTNILKTELEIIQNKIHFSTWVITLYIISFFLFFFYIVVKKEILIEYASLILYAGSIIHLFMILFRSVILSRPPVTNLYESELFVSLSSVMISIFYYLKSKNNLGLFLGSILGVTLMYLSKGYEREGDNLGMIVAVLDTNFWLATHVLTISIGYGFALVTSAMAHYYLLQYRSLSIEENNKLKYNIHLVLLFSLFFTVLGTILGGIWADQSWGRFWGWDPKENGALLICLWLLWIAHAKISRHFKDLSYAFFTGLTSVIVILAWFGVNLLNVGLHSYGFSNDAALNILIFSLLELTILSILVIYARGKNDIMPQKL